MCSTTMSQLPVPFPFLDQFYAAVTNYPKTCRHGGASSKRVAQV